MECCEEMCWLDEIEIIDDFPEARRRCEESAGMHNKELGAEGEQTAVRYLMMRGYEILERNWVCPSGEADIIARDRDCIVFIEVKTRMHSERGFPEEAVDAQKRARYEKISAWYFTDYDGTDIRFRFDVIGILVLSGERAILRHHIDAFGEGCCL